MTAGFGQKFWEIPLSTYLPLPFSVILSTHAILQSLTPLIIMKCVYVLLTIQLFYLMGSTINNYGWKGF